jgi:hypothetical protein
VLTLQQPGTPRCGFIRTPGFWACDGGYLPDGTQSCIHRYEAYATGDVGAFPTPNIFLTWPGQALRILTGRFTDERIVGARHSWTWSAACGELAWTLSPLVRDPGQ